MKTTPEEREHLRTELAAGFGPLSEIVLRQLDERDEFHARIERAIDASGAGSATDAIQDMLVLLDSVDPLPTYCAYCGHRCEADDAAANEISKHIAVCEKHPMRALVNDRDEQRRALSRWVAWHFMKYGTDFPAESERPSVHAQRQAAARSWDEREAFRLFPVGEPPRLRMG